MYDFHRCLEQSERDGPLLDPHYKYWFPNLQKTVRVKKDGHAQRAGIDLYAHLTAGKSTSIDEKMLDKEYGHIYLEIWSNYENRKRGWIAKEQSNDYLAYHIKESGRVCLVPTLLARCVWCYMRKKWCKKYRIIKTPNKGYTTHGIGIPKEEFFECMILAMQGLLLK